METVVSFLSSAWDRIRGFIAMDRKVTPETTPKRCIFCHVTKENGFNILYEDDSYAVFRDRSPGAKEHLLCVPKEHIPNVKTLTYAHVSLVEDMARIGRKILLERGFSLEDHHMGFHIPPFYSIDHLHLHLLGLPFRSIPQSWKYRISEPSKDRKERGYVKGLSWFVGYEQCLEILRAGGRVKLLSVKLDEQTVGEREGRLV